MFHIEGGLVDGDNVELISIHLLNDLVSYLLTRSLPFNLSGSAAVTGLKVKEEMESH